MDSKHSSPHRASIYGALITRRRALVIILTIALLLVAAASSGLLATRVSAVPIQDPVVLRGAVKEQVADLRARAAAVQADIDRLDEDLERLTESYNEMNVRLGGINDKLSLLRRRLDAAKSNHQYRQELLNRRLTAAYKAGDQSLLEILLSTKNFNDFVKRVVFVYRVARRDQGLVRNVQLSVAQMQDLESEIETQKNEALRLRLQLDQKERDIKSMLAERGARLANIDGHIKTLIEQEQRRQEAERRRLEAELRSRLGAWQRYSGPLPHVDDAVLRQVVHTAAAYLGIPYRWGGEKPSTGFDCSGLVLYVFRQHGVVLPHYSGYQARMGVRVSRSEAKPGDVVAFGNPVHHVGIYIGDDKFIEAPRTGDVVKISVLSNRRNLSDIRRFPLQFRSGAPTFE